MVSAVCNDKAHRVALNGAIDLQFCVISRIIHPIARPLGNVILDADKGNALQYGTPQVLRHDAGLTAGRQPKAHLKHLPAYLIPKGTEEARGRKRKDISKYVQSKATKAKAKRQNDPLKSFGGKK